MHTSFKLFRRTRNNGFAKIALSTRVLKRLGRFSLGLALATGVAIGGVALAVDINSASQESLEGVKGIGASRAKLIIDERNKNGAFKSPEDLTSRVRGVGEKTIIKLREQGLTFESDSQVKSGRGSRTRVSSKSADSQQTQQAQEVSRQRSKPQ